jgi:hypothetical protein
MRRRSASFRYYEKWLSGIPIPRRQGIPARGRNRLADKRTAWRSGQPDGARPGGPDRAEAIDEQIIAYLRNRDSTRRDVAHPKFAVGQRVRIANVPAGAHTRLPGYLRGRSGTVAQVLEGDYAYFWHTGDGIGDQMPVYIVEFTPTELWGSARGTRRADALRRTVRGILGGTCMSGQFKYPQDREKSRAAKVAALESLLIEKGVITPQTVDKVLAYFESEMTPLNGKKIVVRAWTDAGFLARLLTDTPAAIAMPNLWARLFKLSRWRGEVVCILLGISPKNSRWELYFCFTPRTCLSSVQCRRSRSRRGRSAPARTAPRSTPRDCARRRWAACR